jgi:hypothetical protein
VPSGREGVRWFGGSKEGLLFLKKKKQKDFLLHEAVRLDRTQEDESFLVLFFKKEHSFFLYTATECRARLLAR